MSIRNKETGEQYLYLFLLFLYYQSTQCTNNQLYTQNCLLINNLLGNNNALVNQMLCNCGNRNN